MKRLRSLRVVIRDSPDKLRRDAAIVSYSRTLDSLVDDLSAIEEMGLLDLCLRRLATPAERAGGDPGRDIQG